MYKQDFKDIWRYSFPEAILVLFCLVGVILILIKLYVS
jgi:hypothetical protein